MRGSVLIRTMAITASRLMINTSVLENTLEMWVTVWDWETGDLVRSSRLL